MNVSKGFLLQGPFQFDDCRAALYNALECNVVDGCWSLWGSLVEERHFEVLKYYTALGFAWGCCNVAINRELCNKLPKDLQEAKPSLAIVSAYFRRFSVII